jgi:hypothetical protein
MRAIETHKTGCGRSDVELRAGAGGPSGAPLLYTVESGEYVGHIDFMSAEQPGMTNEVLLAVVADRLDLLQEGQFPCAENEGALRHVRLALEELRHRTLGRVAQGSLGRAEESPYEESKMGDQTSKRVFVKDGSLRIDAGDVGGSLPLDGLQNTWKEWSNLSSLLGYLDPPITHEEMAVLEGIATTGPARNGLAELKSALANRKVRPPTKANKRTTDF